MLYFLHISKCAGSSFVSMAERNVQVLEPHINGKPLNPLTGEKLSFWQWSSEEQRDFLSWSPWEMLVNETAMGVDAEFYDGVRYVTILRDPIDRLFSAYQYLRRPDKTLSLEERGAKFARFLQDEFGPYWRRNYLTAALTYRQRRNLRHRLELAKRRMAQFDHVFFVETLPAGIGALAEYGWTDLNLPWRNVLGTEETKSRWSAAREALAEHPRLLAQLLEQNEQDLELYAFAHELARQRQPPAARQDGTETSGDGALHFTGNFEFLSALAYQAYVKGDMLRSANVLDRIGKLPEAAAIDIGAYRSFSDFAFSRFGEPLWATREYRRRVRERWTSRLSKQKTRDASRRSQGGGEESQHEPDFADDEQGE